MCARMIPQTHHDTQPQASVKMCGIELFYRWLLLPMEAADTHPFRCKEDRIF
jgi:hypothetical protein